MGRLTVSRCTEDTSAAILCWMQPRRAVIHEWVEPIGGSEAVTAQILRALPGSDFYALWIEPGAAPELANGRQTGLRFLPRKLRRFAALATTPSIWRHLDTPAYDTVVTSTHALGHTARFKSCPDALYLSYVHSPARYVWSPELDERGAKRWMRLVARQVQRIDLKNSQHVSAYACNSSEVQRRVQKYWNRDSVVIPPPVDVDFFAQATHSKSGDFLLSVGRLIPYKRHDFAIRIGEAARMPVTIIGTGPEEGKLRDLARRANVPVAVVTTNDSGSGSPTREQIRAAMAQARALVFVAYEDFGIVPVEAQAVGLPVIGIAQGGLLDSVIDGVTGVLLDSHDPREFAAVLPVVDRFDSSAIRTHATAFSADAFRARFGQWVHQKESA